MECVMLVGIPTSGKSTYVDKLLSLDYWKNSVVLSTDYYIEFYAKEQGKTYNEVFDEHIKEATKMMEKLIPYAIDNGKDIIWDQTNLSVKARKKKLSKLPSYCHRGAVYFEIALEEALERNNHREGKFIPKDILKRMYHQFEKPTVSEGFDYVECGTKEVLRFRSRWNYL
jgi:tRNA uridine 5-carbamoylmethylation protein Kti12